MSRVMRVALSGYNVFTDTNPDHFSLYTDEDWVLIKEFTRGSVEIASYDTETIYHYLGYTPTVFAYAHEGSYMEGETGYQWVYGETLYTTFKMNIYTDRIVFRNSSGYSSTFKYYILLDNL